MVTKTSLLEEVFRTQRAKAEAHAGRAVLIDRSNWPYVDGDNEDNRSLQRFERCFRKRQLLMTDDAPVWLLTFQAPNRNYEDGRRNQNQRVDLVGLRQDGTLVIFEAKAAGIQTDTPFKAVVQGLDCLACLMCRSNVEKMSADLETIRAAGGCPDGFADVKIDPRQRPVLAVIAPDTYWTWFAGQPELSGSGWQNLPLQSSDEFELQFLSGEFDQQKWTSVSPTSLS